MRFDGFKALKLVTLRWRQRKEKQGDPTSKLWAWKICPYLLLDWKTSTNDQRTCRQIGEISF